jgi:hypothetical protein
MHVQKQRLLHSRCHNLFHGVVHCKINHDRRSGVSLFATLIVRDPSQAQDRSLLRKPLPPIVNACLRRRQTGRNVTSGLRSKLLSVANRGMTLRDFGYCQNLSDVKTYLTMQ